MKIPDLDNVLEMKPVSDTYHGCFSHHETQAMTFLTDPCVLQAVRKIAGYTLAHLAHGQPVCEELMRFKLLEVGGKDGQYHQDSKLQYVLGQVSEGHEELSKDQTQFLLASAPSRIAVIRTKRLMHDADSSDIVYFYGAGLLPCDDR